MQRFAGSKLIRFVFSQLFEKLRSKRKTNHVRNNSYSEGSFDEAHFRLNVYIELLHYFGATRVPIRDDC